MARIRIDLMTKKYETQFKNVNRLFRKSGGTLNDGINKAVGELKATARALDHASGDGTDTYRAAVADLIKARESARINRNIRRTLARIR